MSNRLIKKFTKCKEGSLGYTLMEMLVVIGIIAIICAIAIPSVVSIVKSLRFAQRNDYAKSIFMAAQANLTEMRADGGLAPLQQAGLDSLPVQEEICGFPVEDWSPEYVYTSSEDSQKVSYALVLPVGSVDGTLREQQVIIEYNPLTGNVYAVFYSEEKDQNILQDYREGKLPRNGEGDEKLRKDMMLGYYDGSGLSSAELEIERTEARITFENGEEGIVTVHIPMPDLYVGSHEEFMKGLEVKLDITGEINKGKIEDIVIKQSGTVGDNCKLAVDGKTVEVTYVLDSLANRMSFANLAAGTRANPNAAQSMSGTGTSLTAVMNESSFRILPGENVTLDAEVTFTAANDRPNVAVQNAKLGGVNPMFGYLTKNLDNDKYTLTIENGRNLQNLNAIAPSVANKISSVAFTKDIYWNQTVAYYNQHYPQPNGYQNHPDEAPARALPYFVPIYNDALFGSAKFNYDERTFSFIGISITTSADVPTLSDGQDTDVANHAKISGKLENGNPVRIFNLNIDATKYTVPNNTLPANPTDEQRMKQGHYYVSMHNINQPVNYEFTGLFAYINTTIDSVHIVNPVVKGHPFVDGSKKVWSSGLFGIGGHWETMTVYGSPATGALVGASGYNTLITNCAAYVDTSAAASFDRSKLTQEDYDKEANQNWYGVSGEGAVGGLVGYAKSHRTTTGALTGDTKFLAFSNCFAAVNVSGNMRGNANKHFGYTNGVGGLVGNSELTNFYKCYASGNVRANGCYVEQTTLGKLTDWLLGDILDVIQAIIGLDEMPDLLYCGRRSMGAGGFVGTSHGTRYTNCFTTGNVSGYGSNYGAGGFVGIMSYEETLTYGNDEGKDVGIAQHTVFENCYAVGISRSNGQLRENFSGANARIRLDLSNATNYVIGSYYRALAPYYTGNLWNSKPGNTPTYSNYYIFKDSYYLVQEEGILQDNTNRCATVESYDNLMRMHQMQRNDEWIEDQIDNIKKIIIVKGHWSLGGYVSEKTYDNQYFQNNANLETVYENAYVTGFPATVWGNITVAKTHPYSLTAGNQAYPFTMITGLDYYGDWPARPLLANIVYYEDYADGSTGYYFNNEDTATLKHDQDVVSAGYAIISANEKDTVQVTIGGKTSSLQCVDSEVYTPGGLSAKSKYYVFRIPADLYQDVEIPDSFYLTANVYVKTAEGKEAWPVFYFNPYTAISHLTNAAAAPTEAPQEVYIRTAQQLASLSREDMDCVWDENTTIIQQLNIDAATYDWNNNGAVNSDDKAPALSAIGSADHPFNATYTGTGGYVAQAQIKGFEFAAPLFANVGDKGAIRNLSIEVNGGENGTTIGKATDNYTALVAAVCAGEIENVDLTLTGNVTLKAKTAAGLLAGYISGTEADRAAVIGCDITADTLSVSATNAGAVIGQAEYCDIRQGVDSENLPDDLTLNLTGKLTLKGTDVGAYLGASGDLNGDKTIGEVNVDGLTLTLNGIDAEAVRAGVLAGTLEKGDIKNLTVSLTGAYTATGEDSVMAGVAAVAKNGLVQSVTVNVNGSLTGDTAAGVFGTAENLTVQTTEITVTGTITGTQAAAGMAASIEGGNFSGTTVKLMNTIIKAEGTEKVTTEDTTAEDGTVIKGTTTTEPAGRAAGFAVEIHGQVETGLVITPNAYTTNGTAAQITGNAEAAGFACEISAQVTGSRVAGKLTINGGKKAAGFAVKISGNDLTINTNGVTPALENTTVGYLNNSNNNLAVNGENAAMFAVEIGKGVNVRNCYALGKLTGTGDEPVVSGFAVTNGGAIDGCSANVTLTGGYAFARENTGAVSNSYSWYGDGDANTVGTTATMEGSVVSSYFVDIDVPVTEDCKSADIYNSKKEHRTDSPLKLTAKELNGETGSRWFAAGTYGQYPYGKLVPAGYPYPMLRIHYGNWATPPRYAYGVLYYEKYDNGTWKLQIEDMSELGTTVEKNNDLTGFYTYDGTNVIVRAAEGVGIFNNQGTIVDAGYAVFFKDKTVGETKLPANIELIGASLGEGFEIPLSVNARYTVHKLSIQQGSVQVIEKPIYEDETAENVNVGAWYAHEFGTNVTEHIIRTEGQLAKVGAEGSYKQTHDIALSSSFATIENFKGIYKGEGFQIQKSGTVNQWMKAIASEGKVLNVDLNLGSLNDSFFGNVQGEVTLADAYFAAVGENGKLISTLSGTMTCAKPIVVHGNLDGAIIGTVANNKQNDWAVEIRDADTASVITEKGAVIGTVNSGATVNLTLTYSGDISGSIVNDVKGIFTLTGDLKLGTVSGSLIGTVSGTVTLNKGVTVATMAQNGSLVGTVTTGGTVNAGVVDIENLNGALVFTFTNGAVNANSIDVTTLGGSLVNTFTNGTMTTGAIEIGTLNAPLVAAFNGGTLQGAADSKTAINVDTVGTGKNLFGTTVGGTVKNYDAVLNGDAGLADTLSGTMQNMTLTVNVQTMTADVIKTFSGNTLDGLTVTVNGNMDGNLIENASKTVKNLNLTVKGNMTEDVMTTAAAVEGLTVSVTGNMEGNGIATANGAVKTASLTVTGNLTGSGIATAESTVEALTITVGTGTANTMTGNAIGTAKGNVTTLNLTVNGNLKSSVIGTFSGTRIGGVTVKADTVEVSTSGSFGVITAALPSGKTMETTNVQVDKLNITLTADSNVGGLVGENSGTIIGCNVTNKAGTDITKFTIDNTEAKAAVVGGFVGVNGGTIQSGSTVKANITYIQPIDVNTDKATIGGLVGKMSGGSLNGATVSGSIDLTNIEQIEAAAAIAEAEEQGIELVEEPNPAPVVSNRKYIIGGAVGNLLAGSASGTEANVVVVSVWAGAEQTSPDTFGTSGITNRGPVGMFVGFAGAVTIENCASTETTNETFQFLGEALLEPVTLTNMWKSDVKKDSPVKAYSDSITDGVYKSYDPAGIFFSAAANVMRVTPTLSGCYFEFDGATMEQTYSEDEYFYSQTSAKENVYSIGTTAVAPSFASKSITLKSSDWDSTPKTTEYYYLHNNGSYYQVSVKYTESGPWYNKTRKFILVETGNESNVLTELNASGSISDWDYIATVTLHTLSLPNLSGTYITINADNKAIDSTWTPYDLTNDRTFNQRDVLLACVWTVSGNTITNVKDGTVYQVTATFNKSGTLIMTYAVGDVMFHMYPVTVTSNASTYDVLTFTYQNNVDYQRQYVKAVPFEGNGITSITESDLPGETGEATQGVEVPEATGSTETATVPPTVEDGDNN